MGIVEAVSIYADIQSGYDDSNLSRGAIQRIATSNGPFKGTVFARYLANQGLVGIPGIYISGGALDADMYFSLDTYEPISASGSLASGRAIVIDRYMTGTFSLPANGLAGQIVVNAGNHSGSPSTFWAGNVVVGSTTLSPRAAYTQASSTLGGGAVGVLRYDLYRADCSPSGGTSGTPANVLIQSNMTLNPGVINLRWYGPVAAGTGAPVTIEMDASGTWAPVTSMFTTTVNPSGVDAPGRTVQIALASGASPSSGLYRVVRNAGGLLCGGTTLTTPPDVADFEYRFYLVPDCNGNSTADSGEIGLVGYGDCSEIANSTLDCYEILVNNAPDFNHDGKLDTCPPLYCGADWDLNGTVEPQDISAFVNQWIYDLANCTPPSSCPSDFDGNGAVEPADIAVFVQAWTAELDYCHP